MLKFLQSLALEFPHFCLQVFPVNFGRQGKIFFTEKSIENFEKVVLAQVTPPKFLSRNLRSEDLVYNSDTFFFRTAVLWKLFDIRFGSYHTNTV